MVKAGDNRSGFTLIELSIVLLIIGLIVGGILVGSDMIRQSELRSVITDLDRYRTAVNVFRDKYRSLPGDMPNATSYWGAANADPDACKTTNTAGSIATCNGDGNGLIRGIPTDMDDAATQYEMFRVWQHLANANLIPGGNFTGVAGPGGVYDHVLGVNCPRMRLYGMGVGLVWGGNRSGNIDIFDGMYGNEFVIGAQLTNGGPSGPILRPYEAYDIDIKTDDGRPALGKVRSYKNTSLWTPNCTTAADASALYNKSANQPYCAMLIDSDTGK